MRLGLLVAWYGAFAILMFMVLGCVLLATVVAPEVGIAWLIVLVVSLGVGALLILRLARIPSLAARWGGMAELLGNDRAVWSAIALRLVDMTAFAGRLYFALLILGYTVTMRDAIVLALISMVATLVPAGSLGIREFAVASLGPMLADPNLHESIAGAVLVDRAGEALIFLPTGVLALVWMARRWRSSARVTEAGRAKVA
jgi:uncharacterized membrane protein YbhN (UPF0104 family)